MEEADETIQQIKATKVFKVMVMTLDPNANKVYNPRAPSMAMNPGLIIEEMRYLNLLAICISASRSESVMFPVLSATEARYLWK